MATSAVTNRVSGMPASLMARLAGALYFAAVATAVTAEFILPGRMGPAAIIVPIASYTGVVLLLCMVFRVVNARLALFAAICGLAGLAFEATQLQPGGVNVGMALHGLYCIALGALMMQARFVPRWLGVPMIFAGCVWELYLWPGMAGRLAPYNTAAGLICEVVAMFCLLAMGVNQEQWSARLEGERR
jgi:hypothetical protein